MDGLFEVPGISFLSVLDRFPESRIFLVLVDKKKIRRFTLFHPWILERNERKQFLFWAYIESEIDV